MQYDCLCSEHLSISAARWRSISEIQSSLPDYDDEGNATVGTSDLVKRISVIAFMIYGYQPQRYSLPKLLTVIYTVLITRKASVTQTGTSASVQSNLLSVPAIHVTCKIICRFEQILMAVSSESGAYCASTPRLSSYFGTCCQHNHRNFHADKTCTRFAKPDGKMYLWRQRRWQHDDIRIVKMKVKLTLC